VPLNVEKKKTMTKRFNQLLARALEPTRLTAVVAVVSAAVLLSACASPGAPHTPAATLKPAAAGLSEGPTEGAAAQWWTAWDDATLNQLVAQALRDQPNLAVAQARVARVSALAQVSKAAHGPQAGFSADLQRIRYSEHGLIPPPYGGRLFTNSDLQAGISWSPDFFGQHAAELAAVLGQANAARAEAASAASTLATNVARSYVALARLLAQREVSERALAQRGEINTLTRERVAAGLDTKVEQTQSEGALPDVRNQIEALNEQITLLRRQISVLCGQAPDAQAGLSPRLDALRLTPLPAKLGADLLGRRPDVVAARWRVEASTQDVAVARTQFYPNINLSAFVGLSALSVTHALDLGSRQYGASPAIHLPVFDGGLLRAQLGAKQADLDAAIAQYNALVLDAAREAGDAIASGRSLGLQQAEQAQALASAETAHSLALRRYKAGLGNYLVVLNTESQWLAQRRQAVDLQARQFDTRAQLMKALGGGWVDDTAAPHASAKN
jgi:NodT family efflux transporter outer membrane factor (OMF) lipoprotein